MAFGVRGCDSPSPGSGAGTGAGTGDHAAPAGKEGEGARPAGLLPCSALDFEREVFLEEGFPGSVGLLYLYFFF